MYTVFRALSALMKSEDHLTPMLLLPLLAGVPLEVVRSMRSGDITTDPCDVEYSLPNTSLTSERIWDVVKRGAAGWEPLLELLALVAALLTLNAPLLDMPAAVG